MGGISNGKGKLAEASEEGQRPRRSVETMMMMMDENRPIDSHSSEK
jgi:hypothetical protein